MPGFPVIQYFMNVIGLGFTTAIVEYYVGTHQDIVIPILVNSGVFSTYGAGSADIIKYGVLAFPLVGFVILCITMLVIMANGSGG